MNDTEIITFINFRRKQNHYKKTVKKNKALPLCPCKKPETLSPGLTLIWPKKKEALKQDTHATFYSARVTRMLFVHCKFLRQQG